MKSKYRKISASDERASYSRRYYEVGTHHRSAEQETYTLTYEIEVKEDFNQQVSAYDRTFRILIAYLHSKRL